jgi:predicted lipoprotein with Yx(FWY)xxD motif
MDGRRLALAFVAVIAILTAACTASTTGGTPQPSTQAPTVAPASPTATAEASEEPTASSSDEAGGEDYPLDKATVSAGETLTGEDGKTLYTFTNDTKDSGKSTCNAAGDCATNWPPYTLEADETLEPGDGVTGTITMITRDDGTKQVAYNGMPLYYFKGDAKAGDANGQGLFDKWFIAAP